MSNFDEIYNDLDDLRYDQKKLQEQIEKIKTDLQRTQTEVRKLKRKLNNKTENTRRNPDERHDLL